MNNTQLSVKPVKTVPISMVKRCLDYNPITGEFRWREKIADKCVVGAKAGTIVGNGYVSIQINGTRYYAHRLAWVIMMGEQPPINIDHVNGIKTDNKWVNLRAATTCENARNSKKPRTNTSGIKGVSWSASRGRWLAQIAVGGGKTKNLGRFSTKDEAAEAYSIASKKHHGEFSKI